jgi:Transposase and inactivated derivatives
MTFLGIDLHTNCFTCCYIDSKTGDKQLKSFKLDDCGLSAFYKTLNRRTHVLVEATINTFAFVQLFQHRVAQVVIANTYKLKLISVTDKKTDKVDAEKLARILKMQVLSGEQQISPVFIPPKVVQDLRALFSTYSLIRKQITATKNRIHSLLKQNLFPFTKEFIFGKKTRPSIRTISKDPVLALQLNLLFDLLESLEKKADEFSNQILLTAAPFTAEIDILTSMKGVSVFTATAIMADIVSVDRFPSSKHFTSYLRSAPRVESSNEKTIIKSTNKAGRKTSIVLLSQSLNHFRDSNPKLSAWHDRLATYKKKGLVRMGLCRRVFSEMYQMLKKREYHYYCDEQNHHKKMEEYYLFLNRHGLKMGENLKLAS